MDISVSSRASRATAGSDAVRSGIATTRASKIELSVHDEMGEVEPQWRHFEQYADLTVFQTFDWLAAWHRHIGSLGGVRPAIVVGRRASGDILFLIPLAVEAKRFVRRLTWLGQDLCDYNAPLLGSDFSRLVTAGDFVALWKRIREQLQRNPVLRHDVIELEKMPEIIGTQANPFLHLGVALNPSGAYRTQLGENWQEFYACRRSSATRRRDRSKRNRLAEHGAIRFVTAQNADEACATLDMLFKQKRKSLARIGVADIFARPGFRRFFLDIATNPNMHRLVHVSRLEVGASWAATNLGLTFRDSYYHVLASYDDGEISRFGPGSAHLRDLLRHAIELGLRRFDFTIGDESYKREWCDRELKLYDHTAPASFRGWPMMVASSTRRRAKRLIKRTPLLWRCFVNARSAARRLLAR